MAVGVGLMVAPACVVPVAPGGPNVFIYNLDDLRDRFPGAIDPLVFMPQARAWMAAGTRFTNSFVTTPSCCPSRAALMTGRYPHNNGVRLQSQGPSFDSTHSLACYLRGGGYATYVSGKFLTTWPAETGPPCFDHSTLMWTGYRDVVTRVDGAVRDTTGYSTTMLGARGRDYVAQALTSDRPFLLYEAPQAPHWVNTTQDGVAVRLAVPDAPYADAAVGTCSGVPEADRADKPPYVRLTNISVARGQQMCQSQMRAIMSADDEFGATMRLLSDRGVLADTLVILTSDNGYNWGEHGRTEKFVPYEPSLRVPLMVRWPGHVGSGSDPRLVSYLDLLPTILDAAEISLPAGAPALDGRSLLPPSTRTAMFSEYFADPANGTDDGVPSVDTWRMVRRGQVKYIQTYDAAGAVTFREYYDLATDRAENTNLLADGDPANDPPAAEVASLRTLLDTFATCAGTACVR
jgi:arylsulfatase A-like enzyme